MKKTIIEVLKDIYNHKYSYVLRASILQLVVTTLGASLLTLLMRAILVSSDLPGLTIDNIGSFLNNPLTLGLLLGYLFVLAFLVYFEFSILVEMVRYKETKLRLTFNRLLEDTRDFFKSLSGWHILAFLFYLISTLRFLGVIFSSALLENLYIPQFISGELSKTVLGKLFYYSLYVFLGYLNLRFLYTLPLTVTGRGRHFGHNMAESWRLTKGRKILDFIGLAVVLLILLTVFLTLSFLGIGLASLLDSSSDNVIIETIFLSFIWGLSFVLTLIMKLASLSYLLKLLGQEVESHQVLGISKKHTKSDLFVLGVILITIAGARFLYTSSRVSNDTSSSPKVIGHRGFVSRGVENSLESLDAAAKEGVDYVELDLILSKDRQFIVCHDNNLKRLTGKNISISKSNASQVLGLKTSQNGHSSTLVSFDDYVARAKKRGVKLLVELKPTGSEPNNYEQLFVDKLRSLGVERKYMVMSAKLATIEKVKKLDSAIQAGYAISLQIGDFTSQKVDFYAVEDFSYNEFLANQAHKSHKKIYAWTVNSKNDIQHYLRSSVDGVITDYPNLVDDLKTQARGKKSYLYYFLNVMNLS